MARKGETGHLARVHVRAYRGIAGIEDQTMVDRYSMLWDMPVGDEGFLQDDLNPGFDRLSVY